MTFSEKIHKILEVNELGITSASGLEEYTGVGRSSISAHYKKKGLYVASEPGMKIQKAIIEKLRINQNWWSTGKGEIFLNDKQEALPYQKDSEKMKVLPYDAWELIEDDNREFKKEISNLWDMIRYLKGQGVKSHE